MTEAGIDRDRVYVTNTVKHPRLCCIYRIPSTTPASGSRGSRPLLHRPTGLCRDSRRRAPESSRKRVLHVRSGFEEARPQHGRPRSRTFRMATRHTVGGSSRAALGRLPRSGWRTGLLPQTRVPLAAPRMANGKAMAAIRILNANVATAAVRV
ncbi:MAG: hypothetical protein ACOC3I_09220 [Verrucomicrobiota bacterium]